MSINKHGYWEGLEATSQHIYDSKLSDCLVRFYKTVNAISVVDLGCGMGNYVTNFRNNGIKADGFDESKYA